MEILFKKIPNLAKAFSEGRLIKFFILVLIFWYFVISRKIFKVKKDFPLKVFFVEKSITFYLRYPMDLAVLSEIYVLKEYVWAPEKPLVIFDLGAHFGDTALYYNSRFPEATIIAVEPFPENYERLIKHTKHIPQIIAVHAAVGAYDGTIELNIVNSTLGHSLIKRDSSQESITVPLRTLSSLIEEYKINRIDLLKFDVEGAEFSIFENFPPSMVVSLIGELHFDLVQDRDFPWVESRLSNYHISTMPLDHRDRCVIMATKK
jgi:FkbM family methyltransferase